MEFIHNLNKTICIFNVLKLWWYINVYLWWGNDVKIIFGSDLMMFYKEKEYMKIEK